VLAALLSQKQQQQQQYDAGPVLATLLSPATAFQLLDAWLAVAECSPKRCMGIPKVLGLTKLLSTVVPVCKLAVAAVLSNVPAAAGAASGSGAPPFAAIASSSSSNGGGCSRSSSSSGGGGSSRAASGGNVCLLAVTPAQLLQKAMQVTQRMCGSINIEYYDSIIQLHLQNPDR
jgi:uncharacterized membrane protein YgcG